MKIRAYASALVVVTCMSLGLVSTAPGASAQGPACNEARNLQLFQQRLGELLNGTLDDSKYWTPSGVVRVTPGVRYSGTYNVLNGAYITTLTTYWQLRLPAGSPSFFAVCDKIFLKGPFAGTGIRTGKAIETQVVEVFTYNSNGKIVRDDFTFLDPKLVNSVI
jgi:hypothetical protein